MPYEAMARAEDGRFRNTGVFGELTLAAGASGRVITGLRIDDWYAKDSRETLRVGMAAAPNPTADEERNATLFGGFGAL